MPVGSWPWDNIQEVWDPVTMMAVPPGCLLFLSHGSVLEDVLSATRGCIFRRTFLTRSCNESDQLIFVSCKQTTSALYNRAAAATPCHLLVFSSVDSELTFHDITRNSLSSVIIVSPQCLLGLLGWRVCCTWDRLGLDMCSWWPIADWLIFIGVDLSQLSRVNDRNRFAGVVAMLWVLVLSVSVLYGFVA